MKIRLLETSGFGLISRGHMKGRGEPTGEKLVGKGSNLTILLPAGSWGSSAEFSEGFLEKRGVPFLLFSKGKPQRRDD